MNSERLREIARGFVKMTAVLPGYPKGVQNICVVRINGNGSSERCFGVGPAARLCQDEPFFAVHFGVHRVSNANQGKFPQRSIKVTAGGVNRCQSFAGNYHFQSIGRGFTFRKGNGLEVMRFGHVSPHCVVWLGCSDHILNKGSIWRTFQCARKQGSVVFPNAVATAFGKTTEPCLRAHWKVRQMLPLFKIWSLQPSQTTQWGETWPNLITSRPFPLRKVKPRPIDWKWQLPAKEWHRF